MTWAVLTPEGRVLATYRRQGSALLNAAGAAVVEGPPVEGQARDWRFGPGFTWIHDPLPDPETVRLEGLDRDGRRKAGYARIDRDLMIEVACEVALALAATPEVAALLRPTTASKVDQLSALIAAVKTANP
jgi:hypothetical protein